jgi:hypothetical protein
VSESSKCLLDFPCLHQHKKVQGVQFKAESVHRIYEPSPYQYCYSGTEEAARFPVLSTARRRADINCCTVIDDGPRPTVLSTARRRADDINCCTVTDDGPAPQYSTLHVQE